jgi:hypothetical protein
VKNRPKSSPKHFLVKMGKISAKIWASFVISKKTNQRNSVPIGENSPNLVTLIARLSNKKLFSHFYDLTLVVFVAKKTNQRNSVPIGNIQSGHIVRQHSQPKNRHYPNWF